MERDYKIGPNLPTIKKYSKEEIDDEKIEATTQVNQFKHQFIKTLNEHLKMLKYETTKEESNKQHTQKWIEIFSELVKELEDLT